MRVRHMMLRTLLAGMLLPCACMAGADDLISLYRHAVEYDADYRATAANTEADREEINKARAQFFPKAQFSASRGRGETDRTTQTALGPLDTHLNYSTRNYALSIRQPLFNKEVAAGYQSARAYVSEQESLLLEARGKLMLKVTEAYLQTVYTRERIALLEAKIEATGRQLAQAKKRYDGGVGTVVEVSEAQTNLEVSVAELARARAELEGYTMTL
ncbi:partial Outer membrane protein TolC, partial [Gammaproteobacteria bacterium]